MGEALPISNPLERIAAHFVERKWMRSAKAWRCFINLPDHPMLASMLTALIDDKVSINIVGAVNVEISPAFIVDVPSKGRKFSLVVETCFESQVPLGPYLTALTDTNITLTIDKYQAPAPVKPMNTSPLSAQELRGLHLGFFRNEAFWTYLESLVGGRICDEAEAKAAFKEHFGVESCKDIRREDFTAFVSSFNAWIKERGRG